MEAVHDCCFGLDVHKESVVTCLPCGDRREIRRFSTRTGDLKALVHRLREAVVGTWSRNRPAWTESPFST